MNAIEPTRVLAPGKLFLIGEYAVLEGSPAAALAVDRYVSVEGEAGERPPPGDLVFLALEEGRRAVKGAPARTTGCRVDSSAFFHQGVKLGLGSSAAVAASTVAHVFLQSGLDIEDEAVREKLWRAAHEAHCAFQRVRGSGADLAASIFGNLVVFRPGEREGRPSFSISGFPRDLRLVFLWTGRAAATTELVRAVKNFSRRDPSGYAAILSGMKDLAERFARVCLPDGEELVAVFDRYASLMGALGDRSGAPIVTDDMKMIFEEVRGLGGAAKPSGAGGGDFVLAVFPHGTDLRTFFKKLDRTGMVPMRMGVAVRGVHAAA